MADNLFKLEKPDENKETFIEILKSENVRIEKIISCGHVSPPDFWYDQDEGEWVAVLTGHATIEYDNGDEFALNPGDFLNIPPHQRHRVSTASNPTVWLAVFYQQP